MVDANGLDISVALIDQVKHAIEHKQSLKIIAGGSKDFYGHSVTGDEISLMQHRGIIDYQPTELVIRVRAGTRLHEVEQTLNEHRQMLAFEPPQYSSCSTIGGVVATGLSGPRRAYSGSVRDHLLGVQIINGLGQQLELGGQVMKNVAGYDLSRLMVGAQGTLGIILDVSLKVLPKPEYQQTQQLDCSLADAITHLRNWAQHQSPISASCYVDGCLYLRCSGSEAGVKHFVERGGGERLDQQDLFWSSIRNHSHAFFAGDDPLWRLSVAPNTSAALADQDQLLEWGGGLRWVRGDTEQLNWFTRCSAHGGHATLFRNNNLLQHVARFSKLNPALQNYQRRLRRSIDPHGLFNRGRLGAE